MVAFAGESPEEFKARQERRLAELAERFGAAQKRFERLKGYGQCIYQTYHERVPEHEVPGTGAERACGTENKELRRKTTSKSKYTGVIKIHGTCDL